MKTLPGHLLEILDLTVDLLSGKELQGARIGCNHFPMDVPRQVEFCMRDLLDLDINITERIARSVIVFDS